MAHARQADRAVPHTAIFILAVAAAAVFVTVTLVLSTMGPLRIGAPTSEGYQVEPAVIEAGRDWELQRKAQSGYVDPVIEAGRDWERMRRQQSGATE